jgi:hypothetical protein
LIGYNLESAFDSHVAFLVGTFLMLFPFYITHQGEVFHHYRALLGHSFSLSSCNLRTFFLASGIVPVQSIFQVMVDVSKILHGINFSNDLLLFWDNE